jgi:hypothetical protein
MLENLNQVILNLEKSLTMLAGNQEVELLNHPEYLQAVKEVVQSINRVTRTLKKLEESYAGERGPGTIPDAKNGRPSESTDRILKILRKKVEERRASSN